MGSDVQTFRFLDLPREIRDVVYGFVLEKQHGIFLGYYFDYTKLDLDDFRPLIPGDLWNPNLRRNWNIFLISRAVNAEASSFLYREVPLVICIPLRNRYCCVMRLDACTHLETCPCWRFRQQRLNEQLTDQCEHISHDLFQRFHNYQFQIFETAFVGPSEMMRLVLIYMAALNGHSNIRSVDVLLCHYESGGINEPATFAKRYLEPFRKHARAARVSIRERRSLPADTKVIGHDASLYDYVAHDMHLDRPVESIPSAPRMPLLCEEFTPSGRINIARLRD